MNARLLDLALRKQRLQLKSAEQRARLAAAVAGLAPAFAVADGVRNGVRWLRAHPEWLVGGLVALLVARPGAVLRLARRGFFAWQIWRRVGDWLAGRQPVAALARWRKR